MLSIYRLPNHLPNEKILKVIRKDVFILGKKIFLSFLLAVLPFLIMQIMLKSFPNLLEGEISYPLIVLGGSAYYLFIWLFTFFSFIDYYLDIWIITNERIIDIKQEGFFSRIISEQRLNRIQDVTSEVRGIMPTILHYGNIFVQTAGTQQRFYFHQIPNPDKVRDAIIKLAEINKIKHGESK